MTYCVKCGAQVEDGIGICPQCGAVIPGAFDTPDPQYSYGGEETYRDQTYEGRDAFNGQTYGYQNTYNDQVYGEQNTYNGQTYGQEDAHSSQADEQQYTYNQQGYGCEQNMTYDYNPDYFPQGEVRANKVMGILSYLGILVLIPVIAGDKNSDYLKQHVNQGFVLFIVETAFNLIERIVDHVIFVGGALSWAIDIADFAFLILAIMGIVSAAKGTRKLLPTIGNIKIFK